MEIVIFGDCYIKFDEQSVDPPGGLQLDPLAVGAVPAVKPDAKAVLPISGKASHAGAYKIVVNGQAKAGLIPITVHFKYIADVRVWQPLTIGRPGQKHVTAGRTLCEVGFAISSGRRFPHGINVLAKLVCVPGVQFLVVRYPDVAGGTPYQNMTPGAEVATLEWHTPELAPMHVFPFSLILKSTRAKTDDQWEVVVQSINIQLNEAQ